METVCFLLIGGVAGWLAGRFMKGGGFGVVGNIVVGILGGFVGGFLADMLGLGGDGGLVYSLITAFVGAVLLLRIVGLVKTRLLVAMIKK